MDVPYRTFNAFLQSHFHGRVQKLSLDAGLSCPHRDARGLGGCIYCNAQGSGTGKASAGASLKEQIETQMRAAARRYKAGAFIAYFQSFSNTYAPLSRLKEIYDAVLPYPEIVGLSIGTRPDCVDDDVLALIASYADKRLVWMEYGLQSANDETLKRINRGHDRRCFQEAVERTARFPLRICAREIDSADAAKGKTRPCLHHALGRCMGVCAGLVTPAEYRERVDDVIFLLQGQSTEVVERLRK
ncbi:MAG TPA: TIGR01212 family radical SAM protein, partial [Deltaproteobacteria bacterium]|nr:TIGR01212 family radical SAM protein [Deltaproteobacteria bacterium]